MQLANHKKATVATELPGWKFQLHTAVEVHPICLLQACTLAVIRKNKPDKPSRS